MRQFFTFIEQLRKFGIEFFERYYAKYPGIVVDIKDPEQRGRVRLQLPTLLNKGMTHPAWAEPHLNHLAGKQSGAFLPPYLGDVVDVFFENGDLNFPRYCGGFWAEGELPPAFKNSYGNVRGWVFRNGSQLLIDETEGKEQITIIAAGKGATQKLHFDVASGTLSVEAKSLKVTADEASFSGNVSVDGSVSVDGNLSAGPSTLKSVTSDGTIAGAVVTAGGISVADVVSTFNSHNHVSAGSGSPTSGPSSNIS